MNLMLLTGAAALYFLSKKKEMTLTSPSSEDAVSKPASLVAADFKPPVAEKVTYPTTEKAIQDFSRETAPKTIKVPTNDPTLLQSGGFYDASGNWNEYVYQKNTNDYRPNFLTVSLGPPMIANTVKIGRLNGC